MSSVSAGMTKKQIVSWRCIVMAYVAHVVGTFDDHCSEKEETCGNSVIFSGVLDHCVVCVASFRMPLSLLSVFCECLYLISCPLLYDLMFLLLLILFLFLIKLR